MTAAPMMKSLAITSLVTLTDRPKVTYRGALALDTSCLIAVALRENDFEIYLKFLTQADSLHLSAVSRVELAIVSHNKRISAEVNALLVTLTVRVDAFDAAQATLAIAAFTKYGKGHHPAALNFGDCCAYALAKSLNLPLLYKGNDFAQTDVASAMSAGVA